MPWTKKQERFMFAEHPDIAKRVTSEPDFYTKPALPAAPEDEEAKKMRLETIVRHLKGLKK